MIILLLIINEIKLITTKMKYYDNTNTTTNTNTSTPSASVTITRTTTLFIMFFATNGYQRLSTAINGYQRLSTALRGGFVKRHLQ